MSMNSTPRSNRTHIGIFGKRNVGKSSFINALTNQNISLVSEYKGTTTDPVFKAMELLPLGPIVLIDTAGIRRKRSVNEKTKYNGTYLDNLNMQEYFVVLSLHFFVKNTIFFENIPLCVSSPLGADPLFQNEMQYHSALTINYLGHL